MDSLFYYNRRRVQRLLVLVDSLEDIRQNLITFHDEIGRNLERAVRLLNSPVLNWVYDPQADRFGPSKFVGYKGMSFQLYEYGLNPACKEPFNGSTTKNRIRAITGKDFKRNEELVKRLVSWSESVSRGLKNNIRPSDWRFISL